MNWNEDENNERTCLVANVVNVNGNVATITYEGALGNQVTRVIPANVIAERYKLPDGKTACVVEKTTTKNGMQFRPSFVFKDTFAPGYSDPLHEEIANMVQQDIASTNIKSYIQYKQTESAESAMADKVSALLQTTEEDDIVPRFDSHVEVSAVQPVGEGAWDGALLAGGRASKTAPWNFTPTMVPNYVMEPDINGDPQPIRVNNAAGDAQSWSVFNPALKTEKRPAGAFLGSVGSNYHALAHPVWVEPMLRYAEMNGINASVTSWKDGAKCRVDLDVTQATQNRKEAANRMKGHGFLSTDSFSEMANGLDGLYKFGFTINNSLDGRGSFSVDGAALRTYCQNLAVAGGIKTGLRLRHTNGVMNDVNWDQLGMDLANATAELNEWLVNTELLSWIPVDVQLMDQIMYQMQSRGVGLTAPRIVKDKATGEVKDTLRNHLDLAVTQGWKEPSLSYVAVKGDQKKTAYHALQCFTGALTHKPEVLDGNRTLAGKTIDLGLFTNRLKAVSQEFDAIGKSALGAAKAGLGGRELTLDDKEDVRNWIADNPESLGLGPQKYTEVHALAAL